MPPHEPTPIGEIIDEAMAEILGPAGNRLYAELVRQTRENRRRIERETRSRFQHVFADVFKELTGLSTNPRTLETAARIETHRRIQAEVDRRMSEEERAFRERVNRLFDWPTKRASMHLPTEDRSAPSTDHAGRDANS
jgi:hypothetical protein